jgi:hypothetical protein
MMVAHERLKVYIRSVRKFHLLEPEVINLNGANKMDLSLPIRASQAL